VKTPITIDGTPLKTSWRNLMTVDSFDSPYSLKNIPDINPTGIPIREANPIVINVPWMAFAIPPPTSPTVGVGLMKNSMLIVEKPLITTSYSMLKRGTKAKKRAR
jgi:hypothetical protein